MDTVGLLSLTLSKYFSVMLFSLIALTSNNCNDLHSTAKKCMDRFVMCRHQLTFNSRRPLQRLTKLCMPTSVIRVQWETSKLSTHKFCPCKKEFSKNSNQLKTSYIHNNNNGSYHMVQRHIRHCMAVRHFNMRHTRTTRRQQQNTFVRQFGTTTNVNDPPPTKKKEVKDPTVKSKASVNNPRPNIIKIIP